MLVPFYFLIGTWGGRDRVARDDQDRHLHAGRLAADAGRGDRHRRSSPPTGRRSSTFVDRRPARSTAARSGSQDWIFLLLRRRVPGQDAGLPAPRLDARRLPRGAAAGAGAASRACSRRSAPTASCGSCCRSSRTRPSHFQELILLIALASILYGSVMAFTQTNARLIARLLLDRAARLHHARDLRAARRRAPTGAVLQMVNHGLVVAPLFFIIALLAERAGGTEDLREMGGLAMRAPVLAALFLIVALATLAMPGSANFVGEFLHPASASSRRRSSIAFVAVDRRRAGGRLRAPALLSARCTTASARRRRVARDRRCATALVLVPLVAVIVALALYPQLRADTRERASSGRSQPRRRSTARSRTRGEATR